MSEYFTLEILGPDAEQAADSIRKALAEIFNGEPERRDSKPAADEERYEKRLVDFIIIALTIPPALLATIDLSNRVEVVEKVEKVIEYVEKLEKDIPDFDVNFVIGGVSVNIRKAKPEKLVNAIKQEQRKADHD